MKKITLFIFLLTISLGFSQNAPIDFDGGYGLTWTWIVTENGGNPPLEIVSNPNATGINTSSRVAKLTAQVAGQPWALTYSDDIGSFTFNSNNCIVKIMVRKDVATNVGVKFEGPGGLNKEILVPNTVTNGDWQQLTYDFTSEIGKTFNRVVIIPDFLARTSEHIVYFDNLTFNAPVTSSGPNKVTVDVTAAWKGYLNVFNTGGGYEFGSEWGISDLKSTVGATNITLQPNYNTYTNSLTGSNADKAFWTNSADGGVTPGPLGNKNMEAVTFVEPGATFNGKDLTFSGTVVSNTINSGYTAKFFIKALDPAAGYADALAGAKMFDLPASGNFTVSATAAQLASGLIVQYGFVIMGLNANPVNEAAYGSVVVTAASLSTKNVAISKFVAYPNPTQDNWTISSPNFEITSIQVFDVLGKNVMTLNPNANEVQIDGSNLKSGLYFARVNAANGSSNLKLIKK